MVLDDINYESLPKSPNLGSFAKGIKSRLDSTPGQLEVCLRFSVLPCSPGSDQRIRVQYFWREGRFEDETGGYENSREAEIDGLRDMAERLEPEFRLLYSYNFTPPSNIVKISKIR
ncbi:Uncharacterised protein [uncultured archaeon]|nr:Uncharacterised protein [uncultured archaeon]